MVMVKAVCTGREAGRRGRNNNARSVEEEVEAGGRGCGLGDDLLFTQNDAVKVEAARVAQSGSATPNTKRRQRDRRRQTTRGSRCEFDAMQGEMRQDEMR